MPPQNSFIKTNIDEINTQDLRKRLEEIRIRNSSKTHSETRGVLSQSIQQRAAVEKAELENASFKQDIDLKKKTLFILFAFLAVETIAIFAIAFFQGFMLQGFYIEEWSFRLLVSVTITQITVMLLIAVQHLFPTKKKAS